MARLFQKSSMLLTLSGILSLLLVGAACSDDGDGGDSDASADAQQDSSGDGSPDASETLCESYCDQMPTTCPDDYTEFLGDSPANCLSLCDAEPGSVQSCWAKHLGFAQNGAPEEHCPHAVGDPAPAAGTPSDCLSAN